MFTVVLLIHAGIAWSLSSFMTASHESITSIRVLESFVMSSPTEHAISPPPEKLESVVPLTQQEASTPSDEEQLPEIETPRVVQFTQPSTDQAAKLTPQSTKSTSPPALPAQQSQNQNTNITQQELHTQAIHRDITLPITHAAYLNNPHPAYPRQSRRLGEQGMVVIAVQINVDGTALQAHIHQTSGHMRLDQRALDTILTWRFVAGKKAGVPQKMWVNIPINFVLK